MLTPGALLGPFLRLVANVQLCCVRVVAPSVAAGKCCWGELFDWDHFICVKSFSLVARSIAILTCARWLCERTKPSLPLPPLTDQGCPHGCGVCTVAFR